jgi:hypothetical protein
VVTRRPADDKLELGLRLLEDVLQSSPALEWELEIDGIEVSESLLGVEAMNIRETGPNVPLAPEADPGDGQLDVVRIRSADRGPLLAYARGFAERVLKCRRFPSCAAAGSRCARRLKRRFAWTTSSGRPSRLRGTATVLSQRPGRPPSTC